MARLMEDLEGDGDVAESDDYVGGGEEESAPDDLPYLEPELFAMVEAEAEGESLPDDQCQQDSVVRADLDRRLARAASSNNLLAEMDAIDISDSPVKVKEDVPKPLAVSQADTYKEIMAAVRAAELKMQSLQSAGSRDGGPGSATLDAELLVLTFSGLQKTAQTIACVMLGERYVLQQIISQANTKASLLAETLSHQSELVHWRRASKGFGWLKPLPSCWIEQDLRC